MAMPFAETRPEPVARLEVMPDRSADAWDVLLRLGVDPVEHFARLLLPDSDADEKRQDEAAKQLLPYCYARRATQAVVDTDGKLVGYVMCEEQCVSPAGQATAARPERAEGLDTNGSS